MSPPSLVLPALRWLRLAHGGKARALNLALARIDVVEHVLDVFGQFAKARLAAKQCRLGAGALQRQPSQPGGRSNQHLVGRLWPARRAAVDGKRCHHLAIRRHDRGTPAGQQLVVCKEFPEIAHQRVGPGVLDNDGFPAE